MTFIRSKATANPTPPHPNPTYTAENTVLRFTPDYLTPPDDDTLGLLQIGADSCWTGSFAPFPRAISFARMDSLASSAGAPLGSGLQGLEDCHRRMDLINAARKQRGLPVRDR